MEPAVSWIAISKNGFDPVVLFSGLVLWEESKRALDPRNGFPDADTGHGFEISAGASPKETRISSVSTRR